MSNKLKFQGKTVYSKTCVDNILRIYNQGDLNDADWYEEAHQLANIWWGNMDGVAYNKITGVIAALSPQKSWNDNKKLAFNFICGIEKGHTKVMLDKARRILYEANSDEEILDILNGEKTKSFFLNITYPNLNTGVTVDRHAVAIALGKSLDNYSMTVKQYNFFSRCYLMASIKVGRLPHEVQAITWVKWRLIK